MPYSKPWLSYEDQLTLLEMRGLLITDRIGHRYWSI